MNRIHMTNVRVFMDGGVCYRIRTCVWLLLGTALYIGGCARPAPCENYFTNHTAGAGRKVRVSEGTIIVAGEGVGVSVDGGNTFQRFTAADGLGSDDVRDVFVSGRNIYAATFGGGLSTSIDGGATWFSSTTVNGLPDNRLRAVVASGSSIYVAGNEGLSVSTNAGESWSVFTSANGLGGNLVLDVYVSGSAIYAATIGGLSVSLDNGGTWSNHTMADGRNFFECVFVDGEMIYAGHDDGGGLSVSSDGGASWTNYTTSDGLGWNQVWDVYASGSAIYAATSGGLSISRNGGKSWGNYTIDSGLGDNWVMGVAVDGGTIHAVTLSGLGISGVAGGGGVAGVGVPELDQANAIGVFGFVVGALWLLEPRRRRRGLAKAGRLGTACAVCTAGFSPAVMDAGMILRDDFDGTTVDTQTWVASPYFSDSAVTVSGGSVFLQNRGRLLSVKGLPQAVQVDGRFRFVDSSHDVFIVQMRTDGVTTNPWGEFDVGIRFQASIPNSENVGSNMTITRNA